MTEVIEDADVVIFELGSKYDSLDMDELRRLGGLLLDKAEEVETPRIVIDLTQTRYFGSIFISTLFRTWKRVREKHGAMAICGVNPFCMEVLELNNLPTIWTIVPTREEAIQAVKNS